MSTIAKFPDIYGLKMISHIQQRGMPWFRTGAVVWRRTEVGLQFLLVHENRVKVKGVWQDGDGGWNLPCGRIDLKQGTGRTETFEEAAKREVLEESGHTVELGPIVHLGYRADLDNPYLIAIYSGVSIAETPLSSNREVKETGWFTYDQIKAMDAEKKLRNSQLVFSSVEVLTGKSNLSGVYVDAYPSKQKKK